MAAKKLPGQASPSNASGSGAAPGGTSAQDAEEHAESPAFEAAEDHAVVHRNSHQTSFPPKQF